VFVLGKPLNASLLIVGKAYLSEATFRLSILGWGPGFTQERLVRDKHSSLLKTFINYRRKYFYNISPSQSVLLGVGERKKKVKAGTPY
jgi:hypothetical protein